MAKEKERGREKKKYSLFVFGLLYIFSSSSSLLLFPSFSSPNAVTKDLASFYFYFSFCCSSSPPSLFHSMQILVRVRISLRPKSKSDDEILQIRTDDSRRSFPIPRPKSRASSCLIKRPLFLLPLHSPRTEINGKLTFQIRPDLLFTLTTLFFATFQIN